MSEQHTAPHPEQRPPAPVNRSGRPDAVLTQIAAALDSGDPVSLDEAYRALRRAMHRLLWPHAPGTTRDGSTPMRRRREDL